MSSQGCQEEDLLDDVNDTVNGSNHLVLFDGNKPRHQGDLLSSSGP